MVFLFVFVYSFICLQAYVVSTCDYDCPSDKPYYSDVGCIFECPEPFYINGSNCVTHCGDRFVDENRNCVEACPNNTFYEEKLKHVQSGQYLERKCVKCNDYNQFISNGSCVKVCPADSRYIDRKNCANECPASRPYKNNMTLFDFRHYECVEKCLFLADDNFCSDDCPNDKVIFNSSCVGQCPPFAPFLLSKSCVTECPKYTPSAGYESMSCLKHRCPEERSYVLNNTCVERCSETEPLVFSKYNGDSNFNYCVENCKDDQYRLNDQCVDKCPSLTVAINNSCHQQCPVYSPFSCMISKGLACGERPNEDFMHAVCVNDCPSAMLIWNKTCVFSCPSGIPVFGNECVDKCPLDYPFEINISTTKNCNYYGCREFKVVLTCVKDCQNGNYIFDKTCLLYCPSPFFHEDNRCVSDCSATKPFILTTKLALTIWSIDNQYWYDRLYRKDNKEVAIQKCTSSCDGLVIWNSTCVHSCPNDNIFIHNGTCSQQNCINQYTESTKFGRVCLDKCKDRQFVINKTCVVTCPDAYKNFNGTCVHQCPDSHMYTSISVLGKTCDYRQDCFAQSVFVNTCVERCSDGFFVYKSACVNFCRRPFFTLDNECVESCQISAPYTETSSVTVESWISDGNRFKRTSSAEKIVKCMTVCTDGKVLLGSKCIDKCPARLRFIRNDTCDSEPCTEKYNYFSSAGIWCFDQCPDELFVVNDTCVLQCPDDLFIQEQHCLKECTLTHTILHEATIRKYENICTDGYNQYSSSMCSQSVKHIKICQDRCFKNEFLHNNTCLDFCPKSTYVFNRTCVATCPISHQFVQSATTTTKLWKESNIGYWYLRTEKHEVKECVSMCSGNFPLQFRYNCYQTCPGAAPFDGNTTCLEKCPEDMFLDEKSNSCVDKCSSDRGLFNKTCYFNCPSHVRYIHDSLCVSECPPSVPVALKEDRFICRKSCPDDKLFKDGKCIYNFECDDPMFEYGVLCTSSCPERFVWFDGCRDSLGAIIAISVLALVLVMLLGCSWQSICGFFWISRLMFVSEEKLKEIQNRQRQQELKTMLKRNKDNDKSLLMEMHNVADSDAVAIETQL